MRLRSITLAVGLISTLATALAIIPTLAQPSNLPTPDRNGDYQRTGHELWVVSNTDTNGLNCRWSRSIPADWADPSTRLPQMNVREWSVVRRFPQDTVLVANIAPAGFATMRDEDEKPWLKVRIGAESQICLVRANSDFIRPIR